MSTQTSSIQDLKNDILKKVDAIDDKETLKQVLAVLKQTEEIKLDPKFEKVFDRIIKENDGLFKRLAQ